MDNEPTGDTVATKPNGGAPAAGMTKEQWRTPVTHRHLYKILLPLDFDYRIMALERACGLSPTAPTPGVEAIAPVIKNYIDARLRLVEALAHDLDQSAMRYVGIYKPGRTYKSGETVTCAGGLWFALGATDGKPGRGGDWKLVVKSGRAPGTRDTDED